MNEAMLNEIKRETGLMLPHLRTLGNAFPDVHTAVKEPGLALRNAYILELRRSAQAIYECTLRLEALNTVREN
jgi:hypothetical protein